MKKSILIICAGLTIFSISAFSFINWSESVSNPREKCVKMGVSENDLETTLPKMAAIDLVYNVESRFMTTITKEDLHNAKSFIDIYPDIETKSIASYLSVRVSILDDFRLTDKGETGNSEILNAAQIKLIQSVDYSTNIHIRADYKQKNAWTGELEYSYSTPHITIVPEKEAEFISGQGALIAYLRENSKEETAMITRDKLQPGRVSFTVTKDGTIANVKLTSTSGYPTVDEALIELVSAMPENWNPATNSKGEKVDQELVFFFGTQGC